jgi:hypothetical protein
VPEYARSSAVYKEIRAALDPWCKQNGYRRVRGTEATWIRSLNAEQDLSFSFRCNRWGGGAIGGSDFYGLIQTAPSEKSGIAPDASTIRQCDISHCFVQSELDELREIQTLINARRPRTAELEAWMREDSAVGADTRQMYSGNEARYAVGDFVTFSYYSLDDVGELTNFLAWHLPDVIVRFVEGQCAKPKPQPMPPRLAKIFGRAP